MIVFSTFKQNNLNICKSRGKAGCEMVYISSLHLHAVKCKERSQPEPSASTWKHRLLPKAPAIQALSGARQAWDYCKARGSICLPGWQPNLQMQNYLLFTRTNYFLIGKSYKFHLFSILLEIQELPWQDGKKSFSLPRKQQMQQKQLSLLCVSPSHEHLTTVRVLSLTQNIPIHLVPFSACLNYPVLRTRTGHTSSLDCIFSA